MLEALYQVIDPDEPLAVKVVDAPLHSSVPALLLMVGTAGVDPVLIAIILLTALWPQLLTSTA